MISIDSRSINTVHGALHASRWIPHTTENPSLAPILLLHDSLGCVRLWRDFPAQLAEATGRTVIAYDRLGFGASDAASAPVDANFIHEESHRGIAPVLAAYGIDHFILFGHSVGGGMAIAAAAQFGERCLGVISESAQCFVEDKTLAGIRTAITHFAQPGQMDRLDKYHGEKSEWVFRAWTETWLAPSFTHWSLDNALASVYSPLLILHGSQDEFGSDAHPERLQSLSQGDSDCYLLPDIGHVPHREQPELVLAIVTRWLEALD